MSDDLNMTSEEFADYWDSLEDDRQVGEDFMVKQLDSPDGRKLLGESATVLSRRHGVSSDKIKTFRMSMRKACTRAGLDILTVKKAKGTGTKSNPFPVMEVDYSKRHTSPKVKDGRDLAYNRILRWVKKGEISTGEVAAACEDVLEQLALDDAA